MVNAPGWYTIPIRITGLYSFILSLRFVAEVLNLDVAKETFRKELYNKCYKSSSTRCSSGSKRSKKEI